MADDTQNLNPNQDVQAPDNRSIYGTPVIGMANTYAAQVNDETGFAGKTAQFLNATAGAAAADVINSSGAVVKFFGGDGWHSDTNEVINNLDAVGGSTYFAPEWVFVCRLDWSGTLGGFCYTHENRVMKRLEPERDHGPQPRRHARPPRRLGFSVAQTTPHVTNHVRGRRVLK